MLARCQVLVVVHVHSVVLHVVVGEQAHRGQLSLFCPEAAAYHVTSGSELVGGYGLIEREVVGHVAVLCLEPADICAVRIRRVLVYAV